MMRKLMSAYVRKIKIKNQKKNLLLFCVYCRELWGQVRVSLEVMGGHA